MSALPEIPLQGDEETLLRSFLDFYRAALLDRAEGLTSEQMGVALAPSRLTLAGLIGHMCMVEQTWFVIRLDGKDRPSPWCTLDHDADLDAEMTYGESLSAEELLADFERITNESRRRVDQADSLDELSVASDGDGQRWNLRWILIHMIEEYARHCGHADLVRESIDGNSASLP